MLLTLTVLLVVAVLAAAATWWFTRSDSAASSPGTGPQAPAASGVATATTSAPLTTSARLPTAGSTAPRARVHHSSGAPLPLTPASALRLTSAQATRALARETRQDEPMLAGLSGWWVPQVSSKCAGLDVDLGPSFRADGVVDTYGVSEQQILALHTALGDRYSAFTTTAAELGVTSALPAACSAHTLWVSLVPKRFGTGSDALHWCDQELIPLGECGARLVKPAGVDGTRLMLRPGA